MKKKILFCPVCTGAKIIKNGKKGNKKQNYLCKDCRRQFIESHALQMKSFVLAQQMRVLHMLVRGCGIRDIADIEKISVKKVLAILMATNHQIKPKKKYYDKLEIDEFWTFVQNKKNKVWLLYAYHRESGEIVAFVFGGRDAKTTRKLYHKIKTLGISFDMICTDNWSSFTKVFGKEVHLVGKNYTQGIEGNNCRLRQRMRRAMRKTCGFSKKIENHIKAFVLVIFYINNGYV